MSFEIPRMRSRKRGVPAAETPAPDTLTDYITGREVPNSGAEANRQAVERKLVEDRGYTLEDIEVGTPIKVRIGEEIHASRLDLLIRMDGVPVMAVKCVPGSLSSREREMLAACRLFGDRIIPLALISDGKAVILLDALAGKQIGDDWNAVPDRAAARVLASAEPVIFPEKKRHREGLVFRSYDSMTVHRN